jgi:hypothetical protein
MKLHLLLTTAVLSLSLAAGSALPDLRACFVIK